MFITVEVGRTIDLNSAGYVKLGPYCLQKAKTLSAIFKSKGIFENDNFVGGLIVYRMDKMLLISMNKIQHNIKTCSEKQIVQTAGNSYSLVL